MTTKFLVCNVNRIFWGIRNLDTTCKRMIDGRFEVDVNWNFKCYFNDEFQTKALKYNS